MSPEQKEKLNEVKEFNELYVRALLESFPCVICGEDNPAILTFHHVDPYSKTYNISHLKKRWYALSTLEDEINKCVVTCIPCHNWLHKTYDHNFLKRMGFKFFGQAKLSLLIR